MVFIEAHGRACTAGLLDAINGFDQAWRDSAPCGEAGCHHSKLERTRKDKTLTDGGVDAVTDHPVLAFDAVFPLFGWREALGDSRHRDIVALADTEAAGHFGDPLDACFQCKFVKIDITAFAQGAHEIDIAVA